MNRFNSVVYAQHFDAKNSKKLEEKKKENHAVYNYSEHANYCKTF